MMPKEPIDNDTSLEHLLNFLSTTGHKKHKQWKPTSNTGANCITAQKTAAKLLSYLASTMDPAVS